MTDPLDSCPRCGATRDWRGVCSPCLLRSALARAEATDGPPPAARLGAFTLLSELGRGGMGRVWRARQAGLDRDIALKTLRAGVGADQTARVRFRREALAAGRLRHAGIVTVHEVGEADGELYLAMELVRGETLAQRLRAGPLPPRAAAGLLRDVADAVQHAHEAGVIHRDVKPSNILLDADRNDAPRLTDFGIARLADGDDASLTSTLEGLGTLAYLAPEQAAGRGAEQGPATDVYGLGAVLYHCLTGRPPFLSESVATVLRLVIETEPPGVRSMNPSLPRDLETIVSHCLEKQPGRRYPSARDLADELGRWLRDEPIHARATGPWSRGWKWCRRRPAWAALGVTAASSLAVVLWQWGRVERSAVNLRHQLSVARVGEAEVLLTRGQSARALAVLAQTLRLDPGNLLIADRLLNLLTERAWPRPALALEPHPGHVFRVCYRPDGQELITACTDGRLRRWDARTGAHLGSDREHIAGDWESLQVSPSGRWILSLTSHGSLRLWSWDGVAPVLDLGTSGTNVTSAMFSGQGEGLAVTYDDGAIEWWPSGAAQPRWRHEQTGAAKVLSSDHQGRQFATGATNGTVQIWECDTGLPRTLALAPGAAVTGVRFDPSDARLLISRRDGRALLWDLATDRERARFEHLGDWPALFDREGRGILQVLPRGLARIDLATRRSDYRLPRMSLPFFGPVVSPDGMRALAGEDSRDVVPFLIQGGQPLNEPIRTRWEIEDAAFSPDGSQLAVSAGTNTALVWDLGRRPTAGHRLPLGSETIGLSFTPDSRWLMRVTSGGVLHRVDLAQPPSATPVPLGLPGIRLVAFSADGLRVAVASDTSGLEVRHTLNGTRIAGPWPMADIAAIALSRDGQWLAAGTRSMELHCFNLDTGKRWTPLIELSPTVPNPGGGTRITAVEFSPDSRRLAVASYSGQVWLMDPMASRVLRSFEHPAPVMTVRFSPDSHHLATACFSGSVQFWNSSDGLTEFQVLPGEVLLYDVAWSPRGERVATAADDGTIRVWSANGGALMSEVNLTTPIQAVRFHPDGTRVVAVGGPRSGRIWDAASGRAVTDVLALPSTGSRVFNLVAFSPDGRWLAVGQKGGAAFLFRLTLAHSTPPPWLPELAETVAGQRITVDHQLEVVPASAWFALAARLRAVPASDEWGRWLGAFLSADDSWRPPEPGLVEKAPDADQ